MFPPMTRVMLNVSKKALELNLFYRDVRDIDLLSGGLTEYRIPGAIVGPTFACLVGSGFKALKYGDRFFYEHAYQAGSFTPGEFRFTSRSSGGQHVVCIRKSERVSRESKEKCDVRL